jgi:hypothetical protein
MKACLYALLLLSVCVLALRMPRLNFDLVPYLAAVEASKNPDVSAIYSQTMKAVATITGKHRAELYESPYGQDLLSTPEHMVATVPFYSVKVLYVLLIRVLQWATGKLILATVLPSVIGYLGIGVLVWYAVGRRSALLAATLMCQPILISGARYSTPDLFGALWVTSGIFLFLRERKMPAGIALLVSVWVRPDAIVYVGFILLAMLLDDRIEFKEFCFFSALSLASCWTIVRFGYSWATLFYNSFVQAIPDPSVFHSRVPPEMYLQQVAGALFSLTLGYLALYVLFAIVGCRFYEGRVLILPLAAGAIAHFLLYPSEAERMFLPFYLVASIMAVRAVIDPGGSMGKYAI